MTVFFSIIMIMINLFCLYANVTYFKDLIGYLYTRLILRQAIFFYHSAAGVTS